MKKINITVITILALIMSLYVLERNRVYNELVKNSIEKKISVRVVQSSNDPSISCIYFADTTRGFRNYKNVLPNGDFSYKEAILDGKSCIVEILSNGESFYKAKYDRGSVCIDLNKKWWYQRSRFACPFELSKNPQSI